MPFQCTICQAKFDEESDLGMHLMYFHKYCKLTGTEAEEYAVFTNE
jgi:hypothetical protein